MDNLTYVVMWINIYDKYGKQSEEMKTFKKVASRYQNNKKVVQRVYKNLMEKTSAL